MISRRNVRVKVLQALYSYNRDGDQSPEEVEKFYQQKLSETFRLYLYNLHLVERVCQYARKDASIKAGKFLPTEEDKLNPTRLSDNPVSLSLENNRGYRECLKKENLSAQGDSDLIRKIYNIFVKGDDCRAYLALEEPTDADHREILLKLFKFLNKNELIIEHIGDLFNSFEDDESLVNGAVKRSIKALPTDANFYTEHLPDPEVTQDFGRELLYLTIRNDEDLSELISKALENWDMERVAVLDLIMLKMALTEFMRFETIPTKVTLNEYVDISKEYSTPRSKEFVNGILDRLMKQLQEQGKIVKTGRGLVE